MAGPCHGDRVYQGFYPGHRGGRKRSRRGMNTDPSAAWSTLLYRVGGSHMAWRAFEQAVTLEYARESGLNAFKQ
jgi:hypothetical protein